MEGEVIRGESQHVGHWRPIWPLALSLSLWKTWQRLCGSVTSHCLRRELDSEPRGNSANDGFLFPSFDATLISLICGFIGHVVQLATLSNPTSLAWWKQSLALVLPYPLSLEIKGGRGGGLESRSPESTFPAEPPELPGGGVPASRFHPFSKRRPEAGVWGFEFLCRPREQGPYIMERRLGVKGRKGRRKTEAATGQPGLLMLLF